MVDRFTTEKYTPHTRRQSEREAVNVYTRNGLYVHTKRVKASATWAPSISKNLHYAFFFISWPLLCTYSQSDEVFSFTKKRAHIQHAAATITRTRDISYWASFPLVVIKDKRRVFTYRADQPMLWLCDHDRWNRTFHRNPVASPSWVEVANYHCSPLLLVVLAFLCVSLCGAKTLHETFFLYFLLCSPPNRKKNFTRSLSTFFYAIYFFLIFFFGYFSSFFFISLFNNFLSLAKAKQKEPFYLHTRFTSMRLSLLIQRILIGKFIIKAQWIFP